MVADRLRTPMTIKELKYLENITYVHSQMNLYRLKNIDHVKQFGIAQLLVPSQEEKQA
jgi:hypothetical protein